MNPNLKENERELIKLVIYFRKKADKLIQEGKLGEEHSQMITACESLVEKLELHANNRKEILSQRELLKSIVKDQASCPKCSRNTHLKHTGVATSEQGWKSNKYQCRRCNIQFVWNRPNNPWDLVPFMETYLKEIREKAADEVTAGEIDQVEKNLSTLKPVLEAADQSYEELKSSEAEMDRMIHTFKKHLLIEKIKMVDFDENP